MSIKKIFFIHVAVFIILLFLLLIFYEDIYSKISSTINYKINKESFIELVIYFTVLLLVISTLIIRSIRKPTVIDSKSIQNVNYFKEGFILIQSGNIKKVFWRDIIKVTVFKVDLLISDEICFSLELNKNKIFEISESSAHWKTFNNMLHQEFPEIDQQWESKIVQPAFEKMNIEIYNAHFVKILEYSVPILGCCVTVF